jgi:hypothetical protein
MNLELNKEELELIQAKRQEEEMKAEARQAQIQADIINKKVDEAIEVINANLEAAKKQLLAVESTVAKMKELYPDAEVTSDKVYQPAGYNRYIIDRVHIRLANGIKVSYRVYADGSLGRISIDFNTIGQWDILKQLNGLSNLTSL